MVSTNSKTKYCIKYGGTKCNKTVIRTILKYINNYNREESGKRKIEKGIEREKGVSKEEIYGKLLSYH